MDVIVEDIFKEICIQMDNKEVKNKLYNTIVRPLVLYTAYQLRAPLIGIGVMLLILILLLASIWWNTWKNKC